MTPGGNVLIAAFRHHPHHAVALEWLDGARTRPWTSPMVTVSHRSVTAKALGDDQRAPLRGVTIRVVSQTVKIDDVARSFEQYIKRVAEGEEFILSRDNIPIAELRPAVAATALADLPALFASLPHMSRVEASEFADDVARGRESLEGAEVRDAWQS